MNERETLALAQGWKRHDTKVWENYWMRPDGKKFMTASQLPDPRTNPADCDKLIDWLTEKGCTLTVTHTIDKQVDGELLYKGKAYTTPYLGSRGDVVVDLAMKVIHD